MRFIKRVNELRLDFNVVVAITGIEYAFDMSDTQNFVYLLRSASVYLNQNSFFKFILTMKKYPEISKQLSDDKDGANDTGENSAANTTRAAAPLTMPNGEDEA